MKTNSKKIRTYKAEKARSEKLEARQKLLDSMTEEEKADFLAKEEARQKASLREVADLLSFADYVGGPY